MTTAEVARMLKVHRNTIDAQRRAGLIGYFTIGNRVLFTEDHVAEYINQQDSRRRGGRHPR